MNAQKKDSKVKAYFKELFSSSNKVELKGKELRNNQQQSANLSTNTWSTGFDGEKNLGELGAVKNYYIDYPKLRERSHQYFLESDIINTIIERFSLWVVKNGLRLQMNPIESILKESGVNADLKKYSKSIELRYKIWANSKKSTKSENQTFNKMLRKIFEQKKIAGDVLVVLWVVDGRLKVQTIDGAHLVGNTFLPAANGNYISHGVECDGDGKHVAYHVRTVNGVKRVRAYDKGTKLRTAFLVYGSTWRCDAVRGYPATAAALETASNIDSYTTASLTQADDIKRVSYALQHNQHSTGESHMGKMIGAAMGDNRGNVDSQLDPYQEGSNITANLAATTGRNFANLPIGSELKSLESKNELFF